MAPGNLGEAHVVLHRAIGICDVEEGIFDVEGGWVGTQVGDADDATINLLVAAPKIDFAVIEGLCQLESLLLGGGAKERSAPGRFVGVRVLREGGGSGIWVEGEAWGAEPGRVCWARADGQADTVIVIAVVAGVTEDHVLITVREETDLAGMVLGRAGKVGVHGWVDVGQMAGGTVNGRGGEGAATAADEEEIARREEGLDT